MTALDIAREYFPGWSDQELDWVIWEHTGFPGFWHIPGDGATPEECLRTQLARYKAEVEAAAGTTDPPEPSDPWRDAGENGAG